MPIHGYKYGRRAISDSFLDLEKGQTICKFVFSGNCLSSTFLTTVGGRVYRSKDYKKYVAQISKLMQDNYLLDEFPIGGWWFKVLVNFRFSSETAFMSRDLDNLIKPILDAGSGLIWGDDRYVAHLECRKIEDLSEEVLNGFECEIQIMELIGYAVGYCEDCGKRFVKKRAESRFCSSACSCKFMRKRRKALSITQYMVECDYCHKKFLRKPSLQRKAEERNLKHIFCNRECFSAYRQRVKREGKKIIFQEIRKEVTNETN